VLSANAIGQKPPRPYRCGFVTKDSTELKAYYRDIWRFANVMRGERVASVGAGNGYVEAQINMVVDSVNWTLQDIDTACLNAREWANVLAHHEKIMQKKSSGSFELVRGAIDQTNLARNHFDRILLFNVYHELSAPTPMLADIRGALNADGVLVLMEKMARKKGERRRDCGHVMPWEPDLLHELEQAGFKLESKVVAKTFFTFYTFRLAQRP
jgi:SAM-dependent methyltransferase